MREGTMRKLATGQAGLEILHLGDCFGLLESVPVGRIGFLAGGEVVILRPHRRDLTRAGVTGPAGCRA
jgi:hypothetical protein